MKNLTERENEVANLVVQGLTNKEIACELYLSSHTVKAILENIYAKFEIHNRVQLAVIITKNKYLKIG